MGARVARRESGKARERGWEEMVGSEPTVHLLLCGLGRAGVWKCSRKETGWLTWSTLLINN